MENTLTRMINRRKFVKEAAVLSAAVPLMPHLSRPSTDPVESKPLTIHLFSKHLQFLDYEEMADRAAAAGFDGLDLTVRKGGHVEPERVEKDLPRAVKAIHGAGMKSIIMATNVNDAEVKQNQRVLETAANEGINLYRMEYYSYREGKTIPESIVYCQDKMKELSEFNMKLGIMGCYQNHAGTRMGSSLWELYAMMMKSDKDGLGSQYDVRHATVEGGLNWTRGLELIHKRIRSFVLKDFKWTESGGEWHPENVPLGEGMVDWEVYFGLLKSYDIDVPVSLHMEYPLGGAEKGHREIEVESQVVYDAMKRDLKIARQMWRKA